MIKPSFQLVAGSLLLCLFGTACGDASENDDADARCRSGALDECPFDAGLDGAAGSAGDRGKDGKTDSPVAGTSGGSAGQGGTGDVDPLEDGGIQDAEVPDQDDAGDLPDGDMLAIRVLASNLTSGDAQSYDEGHGIRIMQGLDPDVILVQEFNYGDNSQGDIREMVDEAVGPGFSFFVETGKQIPNGIISRWPIIASGTWDDPEVDNREFAWARIDIPGDADLWAVSLHLLTRNASTRQAEADELVDYIEAAVPESDYLVVGGDLNTSSVQEAAFTSLSAVVLRSTTPVDANGNANTNAGRTKPYDQVLPDPDLDRWAVPTVIGSQSFPNGLVFDSRVYTPLSDVAPILAGDSAASMMQHMGVLRDFLIPLD